MKYLLIILAMILVLISIENAEKEAELKEIQIIKEAENSNDPVLKQKAANMKAEIAREEQAKLQRQIENQKSEEQLQELSKKLGIEGNILENIIFMAFITIIIAIAYIGIRLILKPR